MRIRHGVRDLVFVGGEYLDRRVALLDFDGLRHRKLGEPFLFEFDQSRFLQGLGELNAAAVHERSLHGRRFDEKVVDAEAVDGGHKVLDRQDHDGNGLRGLRDLEQSADCGTAVGVEHGRHPSREGHAAGNGQVRPFEDDPGVGGGRKELQGCDLAGVKPDAADLSFPGDGCLFGHCFIAFWLILLSIWRLPFPDRGAPSVSGGASRPRSRASCR